MVVRMIEEQATIIRADGDYAWVEPVQRSACGGCEHASGCGTGVLSQVFGRRKQAVRVINGMNARVGERVIIGIREGVLVRNALLLYLVPLICLMLGAGFAQWWSTQLHAEQPQLWSIVGGGLCFGASLWLIRLYSNRRGADPDIYPVVIRRDIGVNLLN